MAGTVSFVGTLWADGDSLTGESGGNLDIDSEVQGSGCIGAKVASAATTFKNTGGPSADYTGQHAFVWLNCLTPTLDTMANGGLRVVVDSNGTGSRTYYVAGSDENYGGGWKCFPVDPYGATPDVETGTLGTDITGVGGTIKTISGIMGKFNNGLRDSIRVGEGLNLTGGTADFDDFLAADEGTKANRYGVIRSSSGVFFIQGGLFVGTAGTAGTFTALGQIAAYEDNGTRVSDTFNRIVAENGTVTLGSFTAGIPGDGCVVLGNPTRPVSLVAAATGTLNFYASTLYNVRELDLNATCEVIGTSIVGCDLSIQQGGAEFTDATIVDGGGGTAPAFIADNLSKWSGGLISNAAVGVKLPDGPGPFTLDGTKFANNTIDVEVSDPGDVLIYNSNGSDAVSATNVGGGTASIPPPAVLFKLTGLADGSEVRIFRDSDSFELAGTEAVSGGEFTYNYDYTVDVAVNIVVHSLQYEHLRLSGITLGSSDNTIPIQQRFDRVYENP